MRGKTPGADMADARLIRLSKLLSLILRHEPAKFGVTLDPEGYASLGDVLSAIRGQIADATEADLVSVVETLEPDKRRFAISDGEIRANYGHSLAERIAHERTTPPVLLWHGTTAQAAPSILRLGIHPMKRQYVHLTTSTVLALRVGGRRGPAALIAVDAARAHADGIHFYRANAAFWLADQIAPQYLREPEAI